jgi:hypothetical protein
MRLYREAVLLALPLFAHPRLCRVSRVAFLGSASGFAFFLDHDETLVCEGDVFDPGILMVGEKDEVGWHGTYRLVLGPGYVHVLATVVAVTLAEELDRLVARNGLADGFDPLVHRAVKRFVPC